MRVLGILAFTAALAAGPAVSASYCGHPLDVSLMLDGEGYLPAEDEGVTTTKGAGLWTRWERPQSDLWAETIAVGEQSCITDHHPEAGIGAGKVAQVGQ